METILERERNLWTASNVATRAWRETNGLLDELSGLVGEMVSQRLSVNVEKIATVYDSDADEWTFQAAMIQWSLTPRVKGRRYPVGWLYASATVGPKSGAQMIFERPSLTIGYVAAASYEGPIDEVVRLDVAAYWEGAELLGDCVCIRRGSPGTALNDSGADWCFALPLFLLSDIGTLSRLAVEPAIALLGGRDPAEAFESSPSVFRFHVSPSGAVVLR